jgi:IS5 family transposase
MKQMSFAAPVYRNKGKKTKRETFLAEMDKIVPWDRLSALIAPHYPKAGNGRQPMALERMLRIYCLQQWFALSDPGMEEALYDSESMRRFVGIDCAREVIPDESTILKFRHLLEKHKLTEALFAQINSLLAEQGLLLGQGTIVDATIIAAPSSTKNQDKARDPEMHQTKKGNQWYFGMKAHIGVDADSRLTHTLSCTAANVADPAMLGELLHGEEQALWGDSAYACKEAQQLAEQAGIQWNVHEKGQRNRPLTDRQKARNTKRSRVRALGEHPFWVVKHLWKYVKVRYKGLAKNAAQLFSLFALANLFLVRKKLLAAAG